jgi:small conductance mechanosensitive channel
MQDNVNQLTSLFNTYGLPLIWKILGAIALWIIGGWIIRAVLSMVSRGLTARKMDATLIQYIGTSLNVLLKILLVIAILSVFGIQTTSFAAIIAAAGVAIGLAWSGLLANFAAGVFLIILRPFKVGDAITAGGVTGVVKEIGLFATTLHSPDNLKVVVGNNKIFSDNIINYTSNPFRAVDLRAQLAHSVDSQDAIARLRTRVAKIANVVADPAPLVDVLEFNAAGTLLVVRPFCHNNDYWQVYFDTNRAIQEVSKDAGYPVPEPRQAVRSLA